MTYGILIALHLIAVISWMAGMLYLPRLFVYHCQVAIGSEASELFKVMERKLLRFIINPAMIASWVLGLLLVFQNEAWTQGWFHVKMTLLIGMQIAHAMLARHRRLFAADKNMKSERYFRWLNELPTLLMVAIIFTVILKAF